MKNACLILVAILLLSIAAHGGAERFAPGVISTDGFETHPAFTPDGNTIYFLRSRPNFTGWTIWTSSRDAAGKWSLPKVAPFSGTDRDADPYITPDGTQLYFISDRPGQRKDGDDMDLWVMERLADGKSWGEPLRLPPPFNSDGNEWFPRLTDDGWLYFGSDRAGGQGATDIYRAKLDAKPTDAAENLGAPINSPADEFEPCVSRDGKLMIFMAGGRPDEMGNGDLYLSRFDGTKWSTPTLLPPSVNGKRMEIGAWLSFDGKELWFGSASQNNGKTLGDICRITMEEVTK